MKYSLIEIVQNEPLRFLYYKMPDYQVLIISNNMTIKIKLKNGIDFSLRLSILICGCWTLYFVSLLKTCYFPDPNEQLPNGMVRFLMTFD